MQKSSSSPFSRPVANWVLLGVFMLLVQVMLGGITRLTGSGLSITEWEILTGFLPPLNASQWEAHFREYQQTPQYHLLHAGFSLSDFKFIFFWEWFHRFWARMVMVVFVAGFIYLFVKKQLNERIILPLLILFLMVAMQGLIGWIMVKSGLTGDAVYVKPTKLALHFVFAMGLICYAWWFAVSLRVPGKEMVYHTGMHQWTLTIIVILFIQLAFGALMAGHKAAAAASTWPTINGDWLPGRLWKESPPVLNLIDNPITIHFFHRSIAYLLLVLTLLWTFNIYRVTGVSHLVRKSRWLPVLMVLLQVLLGISSVLTSPGIVAGHWGLFEWLAQLHQIVGMLFLLVMIYMLFLLRRRRPAGY